MKKVLAKTSELTREQWLMLRKQGIGGSDAGSVLGCNKWRGALDIYWDKVNPNLEPQKDNEAMYWGRTMEPILREEFAKRTGLQTVACPFMFASQEYPFMIADIDGVVTEADGSKALLEIKTANEFAAKEWENGVPASYGIQCFHYLAVLPELSRAYIAVLIGGNTFKYEVIERDEETIQTLIAMEKNFWNNHVLKRIPPEPDATSGAVLNSMYPTADNTSIILPAEADQLIAQIEECKSLEDDLKKTVAEAEAKLKGWIGKSESGRSVGGYCVHWKNVTTSRLDTTKLKAEQPDLVAKYTKTTSSRRFSITAPKA